MKSEGQGNLRLPEEIKGWGVARRVKLLVREKEEIRNDF